MKQGKSNISFPGILFHEGLNYYSYKYFGVHRTMGKYSFRLWAPDATQVYLMLYIDGSVKEHPMKKITDRGIWELFIYTMPLKCAEYIYDDLEDVCYRYKIITKDGKYIRNDPFSFMLSAESNSTLINTRNSYSFNDLGWEIKRADVILYEGACPFHFNILRVDLYSLAKNMGLDYLDYKAITKVLLPYVRKMKYSYVLFSPVNQGVITEKGNYYSKSLFSLNCYPGAIDDFKYLVNRFHNHHVGVILDFAPSFYVDTKYGLTNFTGFGLYNYSDEERSKGPEEEIKWFNLSCNENISYLISAAFYWLEVFHVDGLNILYPESFYNLNFGRNSGKLIFNRHHTLDNREGINFLKQLNTAVYNEFPIKFIMTEQIEYMNRGITPVSNINVGFNYGINKNWIYKLSTSLCLRHRYRLFDFLKSDYILSSLHGDLSQCEESLIKDMLCNGDRFAVLRVMKVLQMTLPGKKFDIMGDDLGQSTIEKFIKSAEPGTEEYHARHLYSCFVQRINWLYFFESCLYDNDYSGKGFSLIDYQYEKVIAYRRISASKRELLVVINLSTETIEEIMLPAKIGTEYYASVLNTNEKRFGGTGGIILGRYRVRRKTWDFKVELPPLSAVILEPIKEWS